MVKAGEMSKKDFILIAYFAGIGSILTAESDEDDVIERIVHYETTYGKIDLLHLKYISRDSNKAQSIYIGKADDRLDIAMKMRDAQSQGAF